MQVASPVANLLSILLPLQEGGDAVMAEAGADGAEMFGRLLADGQVETPRRQVLNVMPKSGTRAAEEDVEIPVAALEGDELDLEGLLVLRSFDATPLVSPLADNPVGRAPGAVIGADRPVVDGAAPQVQAAQVNPQPVTVTESSRAAFEKISLAPRAAMPGAEQGLSANLGLEPQGSRPQNPTTSVPQGAIPVASSTPSLQQNPFASVPAASMRSAEFGNTSQDKTPPRMPSIRSVTAVTGAASPNLAQAPETVVRPQDVTQAPSRVDGQASFAGLSADPMSAAEQSSPLTLDTTSEAWVEQLAEAASGLESQDVQGIEIVLEPESLGTVRLRVEMREGAAFVHLSAENPEATKLLAANETRLSEAMTRAGVSLGGQSMGQGGDAQAGADRRAAALLAPEPRRESIATETAQSNSAHSRRTASGRVNLLA